MLTCAFLAGTFLAADAAKAGDDGLATTMGSRALACGIVTGAVALAGVLPLRNDAPKLWDGLTGVALPLVAGSAVAGAVALRELQARRWSRARVAAVAAVGAVVVGWGVGQYPWVLVDHLSIEDGAGARATLIGLLVVGALAAAIVVPSLAWLFRLVQAPAWHEDEA